MGGSITRHAFNFCHADHFAFAKQGVGIGLFRAFEHRGQVIAHAVGHKLDALHRKVLGSAGKRGFVRIRHNGFFRRAAGGGNTKLGANLVCGAFAHEAIGGQLAAKNGNHAVKALFRMIHNMEVTAGLAPGGAAWRVEGACARKGAQNTVAAHIGEQRFANFEQAQHFLAGGGCVVRPVGGYGRGAKNGDGAVRHINIAIRAGVQAVDHARGKAVVKNHERATVGRNRHILTSQRRNAARP